MKVQCPSSLVPQPCAVWENHRIRSDSRRQKPEGLRIEFLTEPNSPTQAKEAWVGHPYDGVPWDTASRDTDYDSSGSSTGGELALLYNRCGRLRALRESQKNSRPKPCVNVVAGDLLGLGGEPFPVDRRRGARLAGNAVQIVT